MPESTLALKFADIIGQVGEYLGFGRGEDNGDPTWPEDTKRALISYVKSGVHQFYFPPPMNGEIHEWTFLTPEATVTLSSGQRTVALPDDFGNFASPLYLTTADRISDAIVVQSYGIVKQKYVEFTSSTGQPQIACTMPVKGASNVRSQGFELFVWPEADQDYDMAFQYTIIPNCLDGLHPFVYGGAAHHETVLASCLCIAEQRGDNMRGPNYQNWMERLAASIMFDNKARPQNYGYNRDRSDGMAYLRGRRHGWGPGITFDGTLYTE